MNPPTVIAIEHEDKGDRRYEEEVTVFRVGLLQDGVENHSHQHEYAEELFPLFFCDLRGEHRCHDALRRAEERAETAQETFYGESLQGAHLAAHHDRDDGTKG